MKNNKGGYGVVFQEIMDNDKLHRDSKVIYAYLCSYADTKGVCYPTRARIQAALQMSETTFSKYIKPLVEFGVVEVEKTKTAKGLLGRNVYHLTHTIHIIDTPQHGAPQHGAPQHGAPQHGAPQHGATQPRSTREESTNNNIINNTNLNNNSSNSNNINIPSDDSSNKDDNNNIFNTTSTTTVRRENNQGDEERKFTPPTLIELMEYKDYYPKVNLYKFFEHYEGNGWIKKDGSPVDSLKALKTLLTQCNISHRDYM